MVHCVFPYNLGVAGCLVGVIQLGCFLVAAGFKTDALTDVAFGANFVAIAAVTFALGGAYYVRQYLVTIAVVLWGVRLATFLALRLGCFLVAAGFKTDALTDVAFGANFRIERHAREVR
ncbi:hypothetical protein T484DRAFT_1861339 [Baffinella frigidus]|nr:hypothetical protein T484DRAFT_1861339 [Cryptophyta sp. CCMP2293]